MTKSRLAWRPLWAENAIMSESSASRGPIRVFDIVVAGAGVAGLALAAALKQAVPRLKIAVVDPKPDAADGRLRTVALSGGSRALLTRLGAWPALEPLAQPILKMAIFDGGVRDAVRVEQLQFDAGAGEPLAHMAFNDDVTAALRDVSVRLGVETIRGAVVGFTPGRVNARLDLAEGGVVSARLVVAADGANSKLRSLADIGIVGWDTGQSGIVATIAHEYDHEGRAEQHFLPAGPFAILPVTGKRSSIVWNESHSAAKALLALDAEDFLRQLERRFTLKLGALSVVTGPRAYPFSFRFARSFVGPRLALVGDAAHLVHPLAGQGLNLGLRDVAALAEGVVERLRLGLDPGDPETLEAYQRERRFDVVTSGIGMDIMNRVFSNDFTSMRFVRDLGLRVVDRAPRLKRLFMAEAAGAGARAPKLLRGLGL